MKAKKLTPTQQLQADLYTAREHVRHLQSINDVLVAENNLLKGFYDTYYQRGTTSLIKALRVVTDSLDQVIIKAQR